MPIIFGAYRPRSRTRSWIEANITPRILVKCRALASVTAAVGNKIAVLQVGTLRVITTGISPCIYFEIVVVSLSIYVQLNREGNQVANMTAITILSRDMN